MVHRGIQRIAVVISDLGGVGTFPLIYYILQRCMHKSCLFVTVCEEDLPKWKNSCPKWAEDGECEDPNKQVFMEHYCPKSCNLPCPQTGIIYLLYGKLVRGEHSDWFPERFEFCNTDR